MSEHTPGPWIWDPKDDECLIGNNGQHVMTLGDCYPNGGAPNEADAVLIAAAPDMLEALRRLARCEFEPMSATGDWGGITITLKDWNAIQASIAKATGGKL